MFLVEVEHPQHQFRLLLGACNVSLGFALDLTEELLRFGQNGKRKDGIEQFRLSFPRRFKLAPAFRHLFRRPGQTDAANGELHISHLGFRLKRVVGNLLLYLSALIDFEH